MAKSNIRKTAEAEGLVLSPDQPVAVRLLCDCPFGKADQVVELSLAELEQALDLAMVDDHPDAVAYARALPQNQPAPAEQPTE